MSEKLISENSAKIKALLFFGSIVYGALFLSIRFSESIEKLEREKERLFNMSEKTNNGLFLTVLDDLIFETQKRISFLNRKDSKDYV